MARGEGWTLSHAAPQTPAGAPTGLTAPAGREVAVATMEPERPFTSVGSLRAAGVPAARIEPAPDAPVRLSSLAATPRPLRSPAAVG